MARADGTDDALITTSAPTGAPDARLAELLRADAATARPALRGLRARHGPFLLAYARLCTAGETPARRLAAQAFTRTVGRLARGGDTEGPLRHRFLLDAAELAREWAADERSAGLDPGLRLVLRSPGAPGPAPLDSPAPVPPLHTAYRRLTPRQRGLLWYGVVERRGPDHTAVLLGVDREDVPRGIPDALHALARSCLRARLAASPDPSCAHHQELVEEAVRPGGARPHPHLTRCPHCAAGYAEQRALRAAPRAALAGALLPWAGVAYASGTRPAPVPSAVRAWDAAWPASRRFALASAALGVALAPLLLFLLGGAPAGGERAAEDHGRLPGPPPGATYAQVVSVASGRCLDLRDRPGGRGPEIVTAPCSASGTQRWRVDAERGVVLSYARPGRCLAGPAAAGRGLGLAECDAAGGPSGARLRFTVDGRGRLRPAGGPGTAVSADGPRVTPRPLDGSDAAQRWRAGVP